MASKGKELCSRLNARIRCFPDFPRPGIQFRDIMPILQDPELMCDVCKAISDHCRQLSQPVEAILGLEARGFLFGPQVAMNLRIPFVPVRKKGKLPGPVLRASYTKEYGIDELEVQEGVLRPGMSVLIFDDLIATGGTLAATINLVREAGAKVVEVFAIVELADMKGKDLLSGVPLTSIVRC